MRIGKGRTGTLSPADKAAQKERAKAFRRVHQVGDVVRGRLVRWAGEGLAWVHLDGQPLLANLPAETPLGAPLAFQVTALTPEIVLKRLAGQGGGTGGQGQLVASFIAARAAFEAAWRARGKGDEDTSALTGAQPGATSRPEATPHTKATPHNDAPSCSDAASRPETTPHTKATPHTDAPPCSDAASRPEATPCSDVTSRPDAISRPDATARANRDQAAPTDQRAPFLQAVGRDAETTRTFALVQAAVAALNRVLPEDTRLVYAPWLAYGPAHGGAEEPDSGLLSRIRDLEMVVTSSERKSGAFTEATLSGVLDAAPGCSGPGAFQVRLMLLNDGQNLRAGVRVLAERPDFAPDLAQRLAKAVTGELTGESDPETRPTLDTVFHGIEPLPRHLHGGVLAELGRS